MDESTREGIRRMTQGLTDQKTIEQLTRAGKVAQQRRESFHDAAVRKRRLENAEGRDGVGDAGKNDGGEHRPSTGDTDKST